MNEVAKTEENVEITREYTEAGLAQVEKVGLLSPENLQKLEAIKEGLVDTWQKNKIWRTDTDMRYSVLNDTRFPTAGMKFLQARHEQETFLKNLMYLAPDFKEKQGTLIVLEAELEEILLDTTVSEKKRVGLVMQKEAQIERCKYNLEEYKKEAHHRVRELVGWETIKQELLAQGGFDPDDYDGIQIAGYQERWARELEAELYSKQPNGNHIGVLKGSLESILNPQIYGNNHKIGSPTDSELG